MNARLPYGFTTRNVTLEDIPALEVRLQHHPGVSLVIIGVNVVIRRVAGIHTVNPILGRLLIPV